MLMSVVSVFIIQSLFWFLIRTNMNVGSGVKAESTVWSDQQKCWAPFKSGAKWPDLLSRTINSASEMTFLDAELTFLEAEPSVLAVRTYKGDSPANTSGHCIYMVFGVPFFLLFFVTWSNLIKKIWKFFLQLKY